MPDVATPTRDLVRTSRNTRVGQVLVGFGYHREHLFPQQLKLCSVNRGTGILMPRVIKLAMFDKTLGAQPQRYTYPYIAHEPLHHLPGFDISFQP
jgi:hypothetical protein